MAGHSVCYLQEVPIEDLQVSFQPTLCLTIFTLLLSYSH